MLHWNMFPHPEESIARHLDTDASHILKTRQTMSYRNTPLYMDCHHQDTIAALSDILDHYSPTPVESTPQRVLE